MCPNLIRRKEKEVPYTEDFWGGYHLNVFALMTFK
jgi:hypothetical protein